MAFVVILRKLIAKNSMFIFRQSQSVHLNDKEMNLICYNTMVESGEELAILFVDVKCCTPDTGPVSDLEV